MSHPDPSEFGQRAVELARLRDKPIAKTQTLSITAGHSDERNN